MASRVWRALRRFLAEQVELRERLVLINSPWEEEFFHWVGEGPERHLHGRFAPPPGRRTSSVTRSGWCPGLRLEREAHAARG